MELEAMNKLSITHAPRPITTVIILLFYTLLLLNLEVKSTHGYELDDDSNIPKAMQSSFRSVTEPIEQTDLAVFWHVHKAGGSSIHHMLAYCHKIVIGSQVSVEAGLIAEEESSIRIVDHFGFKFVNVDTTTPAGLMRAKQLGLAQSGLADVIFTSYLYGASRLFDEDHKGRLFAMFRHPVDRVVSEYHYLQIAHWEPVYNPELSSVSVEEFATRGKVGKNWMVRVLTNNLQDHLSNEDLQTAKEVLRHKFIIGLTSHIQTSMERFSRYFGWEVETTTQRECVRDYLKKGANTNPHAEVEEGTEAWDAIVKVNYFDVKLYEYAVQLFQEQTMLFY